MLQRNVQRYNLVVDGLQFVLSDGNADFCGL
jgi:hypothetical protein